MTSVKFLTLKYKLISGAEKIHIATEKGEPKVTCNIIDDLNDDNVSESVSRGAGAASTK